MPSAEVKQDSRRPENVARNSVHKFILIVSTEYCLSGAVGARVYSVQQPEAYSCITRSVIQILFSLPQFYPYFSTVFEPKAHQPAHGLAGQPMAETFSAALIFLIIVSGMAPKALI